MLGLKSHFRVEIRIAMNILGLPGQDIIKLIELGVAGLAFLFAAMSYQLLKTEQKREGDPRPEILKSITHFTYCCLLFAILVGCLNIADKLLFSSGAPVIEKTCLKELKRAKLLSDSPSQTIDSLRELFGNTLAQCE